MHRGLGEGASAAHGRGKVGVKEESDGRERETESTVCFVVSMDFTLFATSSQQYFFLISNQY